VRSTEVDEIVIRYRDIPSKPHPVSVPPSPTTTARTSSSGVQAIPKAGVSASADLCRGRGGLATAHPGWGDIQWRISLVAMIVTVIHVAVDRKTLRACVRHFAHAPGTAPARCD